MQIKINNKIGLGSLICSFSGVERIIEKLNPYYVQEDSVKIAVIEEKGVRSYVTLNDASNEFFYDHHIFTIGENFDSIERLHEKVCRLLDYNVNECSVFAADYFTRDHIMYFMRLKQRYNSFFSYL